MEIGSSAFANCPFAGELEIPATVTLIGEQAFKSSRLTALRFAGNCPETSGDVGLNPAKCTIYVPDVTNWDETWQGCKVCPAGYRLVDYIESTGKEYIDTLVPASATLAATMDYMALEHTGGANLGTFVDDNADWRYFDYSGGPIFDWGRIRTGKTADNELPLNVRYVVNVGLEVTNTYLVVTNAETKAEVKSFTAVCKGKPTDGRVFVFGAQSSSGIVCTKMRLYSLKLMDGGRLKRDFIPCKSDVNGAYGLYDRVLGGFYQNQLPGGAFVGPPPAEEQPVEDDPDAEFYTFEDRDDGTVRITGLSQTGQEAIGGSSSGTPLEALKIPATLGGWPVAEIGSSAFANCPFAGELEIPATVTLIGAQAFESSRLTALRFAGNCPEMSGDVGLDPAKCTIYATLGATGWGEIWQGCPVARTVSCWDPESKSVQAKDGCLTLTSDMVALEGGKWYVVQGNVTTTNLTVNGTVNLVLADGARLTANGMSGCAGIEVTGGNALTIWGQSGGTGALVATGGSDSAGIGGGANAANGTVTINGGQVTAQGGAGGPGIGGGKLGAGGTVKVNGGTVVAKAAGTGTWDVGSGWGGDDQVGEFVVAGGSVHLANSGNCRAGYPQNVAEAQLYCVTVEDLEGLVSLEDLDGYGTDGIFADADGKIYLYLPNGIYSFKANDVSYSATVSNGPTTAVAQ